MLSAADRALPPLHSTVRPLAICLFRHEGRILVSDEVDPVSGERFHRPLGGGIEYGEESGAALRREIREELGAEILALSLEAVLENLFVYAGKFGHEVVFLYDARFSDAGLYAREELWGDEQGTPIRAIWVDPASLRAPGAPRLCPAALLDHLAPPR